MNIGIVGLGRMGANMARRLARGGVRVTGFDPDEGVRRSLAAESISGVGSLADLACPVACTDSPTVTH